MRAWIVLTVLTAAPVSRCAEEKDRPKPLATITVKPERAARVDGHWMAFTPAGSELVVRSAEPRLDVRPRDDHAELAVFDVTTGKKTTSVTIKGGGGLSNLRTACAVGPGGNWVAYTDEQHLRYLALGSGKGEAPATVQLSRAPIGAGASVWFEPKRGNALFYRSGALRSPPLEVWDGKREMQNVVLRAPGDGCLIRAHVLHPATNRFALACSPLGAGKPRIECWSFADREKPSSTSAETEVRPSALAFSADGSVLAAGFDDGTVAWYEAVTMKELKRLPSITPKQAMIGAVLLHPGGKHLICGGCNRGTPNLFFIDLSNGTAVVAVTADADGVTDLCADASGEKVAAFGASGTITVWNAAALLKLKRD